MRLASSSPPSPLGVACSETELSAWLLSSASSTCSGVALAASASSLMVGERCSLGTSSSMTLLRRMLSSCKPRGEHFDDLVQVGAIGLIKAIDRFALSRGVELTTYATPNIVGEIKRYFRDKGWSVRVPRGLQELNIRLNKVIDELVPKLQRSPTINELAEAANATPEEVLEALETEL